ncbi:c-type cytochrome biogenesis protein CcmI [Halofilum ochraceum]|uniref:c-type cytochrome biogenesis protein CcmI n=1 Tax=Halofilum ochraceum TaxID=1611323 RepID=UPI0008DA60A3|nr:c-type cytochrome biogenesis protein CcmI [Halofilum ochraceum]
MTAFILIALIMTVLAIGAVAWPLRARRVSGRRDDESGLDVYRERDAELVREYERGNLNDAEFAEAREELERELLAVAPERNARGATMGHDRSWPTLLGVATTVPVVAVAVYMATGSPGLTDGGESGGLSPAQVERFRSMGPERRIAELEPVVERQPQATRAWILLAQAYRATERYGDAVSAYARVQSQGEPDPWLMARQAEALLLANGRRFTSSVERLVQRALDLDERNPLALMLAGHAAMARGDDAQAVSYWRRLAEDMPADSENRAMLERLIAEARGGDRGAGEPSMASAPSGSNAEKADDGGDAAVTVRVSLAPSLADAAPAGTTVFIFARPADANGGAPLAVQRTTVDALPVEITLTDAQAMTPNQTLSQANQVRVTARASLQGGVMAQSGDLQGESGTVEIGPDARATVTIDQRIP